MNPSTSVLKLSGEKQRTKSENTSVKTEIL